MKKLLILLSSFVFLISPAYAFAEETATTTTTTASTETNEPSITPTEAATKTRLLKKPVASLREETKEAKTEMRDKISGTREDFRAKVSAIKDDKKKQIINNLDLRIGTINTNRTNELNKILERLTMVLGKISTKEASLKSEGKNTTKLAADIASAQTAIDAAKQAVTDQAAKVYTMNITTDTALKSAASTTIQQFMTDMKAVRAKVLAAQQAVVKAHKDLGQLMGVTPTPSPTAAATATPAP